MAALRLTAFVRSSKLMRALCCVAVAVVAATLVVTLPHGAAHAQMPPPPDSCDRIETCASDVVLPTGAACDAAGPCACAQQIDCVVRNAKPVERWPEIPTGELHWNAFFWHTRYLRTLVVPSSLDAFRVALDPALKLAPLPAGTILYKQGYFPANDDPALPAPDNFEIFVAVKLEGRYCPSGSAVGTSCQGGDWFWYHTDSATPQVDHSRFQGGGSFSGYGKPSKCVGCHDAAQRGDFLMTIMIQRRYPPSPGG